MKTAMLSDLRKLVRIAFSPSSNIEGRTDALCGTNAHISISDSLLGRGSLTVSSGRVTTGRDIRRMKSRVLAHDFRA